MYIKVRVFPESKKEKIEQKNENNFTLFVKEPAERNMANNRIRQIMADFYRVNVNSVRILNGHHSPSKILSINV